MFDLTFLGTAATMPSAERGLPAVLVGAPRRRFLIDCGEGTQRQLLRAGSGMRRLGHVLLTHVHLDHVLGLAGLIATLALLDLRDELVICGSEQAVSFVARYLGSIWPHEKAPIPVRFVPLQPGLVMQETGYSLTCFAVQHRGTESLGYRFEAMPRRHLDKKRLAALGVPDGPLRAMLARGEAAILADGRVIEPDAVLSRLHAGISLVVVGDTEEVDTLVPAVAGADVLVMEATFMTADAALAAQRGHLTAAAAGRLAAAAGVGALYLTHLSGRYDPADILAEAISLFPNTRLASDFDTVHVSQRTRAQADVATG